MKKPNTQHLILSSIALLLAGNLWVNVAERPLEASEAHAVMSVPPSGMIDAGTQRKQIVDAINELRRDVQKTNELLAKGGFKVEVSNVSELRASADDGQDE